MIFDKYNNKYLLRFPKNKERRQEWRKFVNRIHWVPTNNSFICSPHFTEECFDRSSALTVRLNENAIPTIIIDRTKNVSLIKK